MEHGSVKARPFAIVQISQMVVWFVYLDSQGWWLYKKPVDVAGAVAQH